MEDDVPTPLLRRDGVLRTIGFVLVAAAWACLYLLATGPARTGACGAIGCLEAAVGVLGTSLGGVLLGVGAHIYDQVPVAARWSHALEPVRPALTEAPLHAQSLVAPEHEATNAPAAASSPVAPT